MTIEFFSSKRECEKRSARVNKMLSRRAVKCLAVKITNLKKANDCGLRPMPRKDVGRGSMGYVVGRNIGEFKGCGVALSR